MAAGFLLDSSALLATLFDEPGAGVIEGALGQSAMSAVNYAEVVAVLVRRGAGVSTAVNMVDLLQLPIVPWTQELAREGSDFTALAWSHGLSLGDRACLATARHLKRTVLTADRNWTGIPGLSVEIRLIR